MKPQLTRAGRFSYDGGVVAAVVLACVSGAQADVVMETLAVGNLGNTGELSGGGAGGYGPDRICGAVDRA